MGFLKIILISSVAIALISIVLHEVSPQYLAPIMKSSTVKDVINNAHHFIRTIQNKIADYYISDSKLSETKAKKTKDKTAKLFTKEKLKLYNGEDSKGLYLAIMGKVFNVKKGKQYYGPDGSYSFFAGRDGSRAFVSGDFSEEGLIDDITGLSSQDYIGLSDWVSFYEKDYKFIGYLIGRFYDEYGNPTEYNIKAQNWISEAFAQKKSDDYEKTLFPPCNSEWSAENGGRVWCTNRSGGIEREWVGVPRKLKVPGKGSYRCACIKGFGPPSHDPNKINHHNRGDLDNPNLQEYKGCEPDQPTCRNI